MTRAVQVTAVLGAVAAVVAAAVPWAGAKDFRPAELRVCGSSRCVIVPPDAAREFSSFLYGTSFSPRRLPAPRPTSPAFEIGFAHGSGSGPVGLVGSRWRDRMRVYGLNCGRFRRGVWYALPRRLARELRRRTATLEPLRIVTPPRSC